MGNKEASEAILELRKFRDEIDGLMKVLEGKTYLAREEIPPLQERLRLLKSGLKDAAKRPVRNEIERDFLKPAVTSASVNLRIPVNSHPIKSDWLTALYGIRTDIDHPLADLEREYPDAKRG
jgi:hypothetical protein